MSSKEEKSLKLNDLIEFNIVQFSGNNALSIVVLTQNIR